MDDTAGLLITACVLAASWHYRDGGKTAPLGMHPTFRRTFTWS